MPKLKGPLFSVDARGTLGKKIIYTRGGFARSYFKPRNPNSAAQQAQREAFKEFSVPGLTQEQADLLYSAITHLHDDRYSLFGHLHDDDYAPSVHEHDDLYSPIGDSHVIVKTSTTTKTSSVILSADDELTFTVTSGVWVGRLMTWWWAANATMDLRCSPTVFNMTGVTSHAWGTPNLFNRVLVGASPPALFEFGTIQTFGTGASIMFGIPIEFYISLNTDRTFGLQWAQNTSNAGQLQLLAGSRLEAFKVS